MSNVILFPDFHALKTEVELLKKQLTKKILERDRIQFKECPHIEMVYMLTLGDLEYQVNKSQWHYLRLKRKVALLQIKINRQETINTEQIERQLDHEFQSFQQKLNEQLNKINQSLKRSQNEQLTQDEVKQLKQLYRQIVKQIHPDLHPKQPQNERQLFLNAVKAYESGDIETLSYICNLLNDELELAEESKSSLLELKKEKDKLQATILKLEESIQLIKQSYPYILKEIILNDDEVLKRKKELENAIKQFREAIKIYEDKIQSIMR